jgi:hypothetical protein
MRTLLLLVAVAIQPLRYSAQSSFPSSPTTGPELEVPVRKASLLSAARLFPAPASTGGIQSGAPFRVGDSFELRLSGMPPEDAAQYAQPFTIGSDGYLSFPLPDRQGGGIDDEPVGACDRA